MHPRRRALRATASWALFMGPPAQLLFSTGRVLPSISPGSMPSQQLSITLDEDLVAFIDQQGTNRSAAIAEAVRCWRDQLWLDEVNRAYDEEAQP